MVYQRNGLGCAVWGLELTGKQPDNSYPPEPLSGLHVFFSPWYYNPTKLTFQRQQNLEERVSNGKTPF